MASKKEWKRRAKTYQLRAEQAEQQLSEIHECFRDVEFPGPSLQQWAYQLRDFVLKVHRVMRWVPPKTIAPPATRNPNQIDQPDADGDGTYTLPTQEDLMKGGRFLAT